MTLDYEDDDDDDDDDVYDGDDEGSQAEVTTLDDEELFGRDILLFIKYEELSHNDILITLAVHGVGMIG